MFFFLIQFATFPFIIKNQSLFKQQDEYCKSRILDVVVVVNVDVMLLLLLMFLVGRSQRGSRCEGKYQEFC
jgi:hypothetical protein